MKQYHKWVPVIALALVFLSPNALAQPSTDRPTYQTGFSTTSRIGNELYNNLDPKKQQRVYSHPVALETDVTPFVKSVEYPDEPEPMRLAFISVGFIDLMNNVSHAKAIDRIEPGYFERYVVSLSRETGEMSLEDLPGIENKKYWSQDIMNEQQSNFNQMVGMVIAIELSHHYLGQFKKYEDRLVVSDKPVPMNNLLTPAEWDASMKAGVRNALECGYGIEGLRALYDAIDKMPKRPEWTAYFLPANVHVSKLKKDLKKAEEGFFRGQ